jgi:rod shape-determining protein MreD
MATLIAIPILGSLLILETAFLSRFPLLHGTADLVLLAVIAWALQERVQSAWQWGIIGGLLVSIASALPFFVSLMIYPAAVGLALLLKQRVWQVPILAMFIATFFATLLTQVLSVVVLRLMGTALPLQQTLSMITLPSMILNLLVAIPVYALFSELASLVYPQKLEA